jgi:hypothetical protein
MDELSMVQQLLAEPPPGPDVVEAARLRLEHATLGETPLCTRSPGRGWRTPGLVRRGAAPRHWPGWLAPAAAAAAVVAVILGSLGISGVIGPRPADTGAAKVTGVFAKIPQFFVAIPANNRGRAVVGATATGAVLGTIAPPGPQTGFLWVTAAGDDRTFVLAAGYAPAVGTSDIEPTQLRFYRLVLGRSGRPGRLTALPIPSEAGTIAALALSPDGSKLAVTLLETTHPRTGPTIQVFSLATGGRKTWVWPGRGLIGLVALGPGVSPNMWEADNRTLLFEVTNGNGRAGQLRLLDTATPGGSLSAASTRVPVPGSEMGWRANNDPNHIDATPFITGDGTKFVDAFSRAEPKPKIFDFTITEFSTHTGKPVQVLYRIRTDTESDATTVEWVNTSGTAVIASRLGPGRGPGLQEAELGVQTPASFTPFPLSTQRVLSGLIPAW